jgi:diguanylate cyclase (GGDEF)-like protein
MLRFRSLSTRLTVQFALLFAAVMLAASTALSSLISDIAARQVESQLQSSGAVYDRLWQQRSRELEGAAQLLARDFGFRAAVATGDRATIQSALENAKARLRVKTAFIVGVDGSIRGISRSAARSAQRLWEPLDEGHVTGIALIGGRAQHLVAAPVMAPALLGWVVFAADLDKAEMAALERLSAIPLQANVLVREGAQWSSSDGRSLDTGEMPFDLKRSAAFEMEFDGEPAIMLAKRLPSFAGEEEAVLLLAYPRSLALAAARKLQLALALVTLVGLVLVGFATWRASGRITRPLARLDEAATRFATGEHSQVAVEGSDELARLSQTFNSMVVEIHERERRIAELAFNDVLTGLPNRTMFQQHLGHRLKSLDDGVSGIALHCLDLDHFKSINDTMGHPAGDALLIATAERLTRAANGHFVARLGGDEFVVVQSVSGELGDIDGFARMLIDSIDEPLTIDGQLVVPSTSIGIALAPDDGMDGEALLKNADLALYRAKEAGRGTFVFFEESLNERAQARRKLENDLRLAIERGEFELYYQPLYDLANNRIGSFEALIRWNHPANGLVPPADFIPVAEDTGLIVPIGAWALREACRQASRWPDHVRVAVNVSSVQFFRPGLQEIIIQALAASGLQPGRLEIEITESIFLQGSDETLQLLHTLRSIGVRIALDDFGTGYSSLSYLQSFPFDKIKIDRSFIENLMRKPGASAVVRAITELASALGMETTAEGVEQIEQLDELRAQGCSSVQGFLFSRPVRSGEIQKLLIADAGGTAERGAA